MTILRPDASPSARRLPKALRLLLGLLLTALVGYGVSLGVFLTAFYPNVILQTLFSSHAAVRAARQAPPPPAASASTSSPMCGMLSSAAATYSLGRLYPVLGEPLALFIGAAAGLHHSQRPAP